MSQLMWFRNDLRLADNPALTAAVATGEPVRACYVLTPTQWQAHDWAPVKTDLLLRSLSCLAADLAELGIPFDLVSGTDFDDQQEHILALCRKHGISKVHANEEYATNERHRDRTLTRTLREDNRALQVYRDQTVVPVGSVLTQQQTPYSVFTPFSRQWRQWLDTHPVSLHPRPPRQGEPLKPTPVPSLPDWEAEHGRWVKAGEAAAQQALEDFLQEKVGDYKAQRDFPAQPATSILSPYLALGLLSGRQCLVAAREAADGGRGNDGLFTWTTEICWRDFYVNILYHYPQVSRHGAFKPETDRLPWRDANADFDAWCQGRTGIPIVDAAMRQLNATGWMHNRLRMVTAMFLSKNLFVNWRHGERYFMQQLMDGYLASNNGGWQWSASTGTDAAPYFRIFNPITQSERFDPDGRFIRHWVPEIAHLQGKALFDPSRAKETVDYPEPIVDLKSSRKQAIAWFQELKG